MKENDREFEERIKKAVCSYHREEMDALPSKEELEREVVLSDEFYQKMEELTRKQKHRWRYRFVRYGAVAACLLLFAFGTVGAAAYALMGAENFKSFFRRSAKECNMEDSAVMDLEQLTDMAVTTSGTVYEDEKIRLDLKGLIKSGNRFSMIVEGTLKQQDQIIAEDGPQDTYAYSFLDTEIDEDIDMSVSQSYYFQDSDHPELQPNQFVYMATYTAEAGFEKENYRFIFTDFGYYQDAVSEEQETDGREEASSVQTDCGAEQKRIAICSGTWEFSVDMDQAKDISFTKNYDEILYDGETEMKLERILFSPIGCSISMTLSESDADSSGCFDKIRIRLKNGSLLSEECYEIGVTDSGVYDEDGRAENRIKREIEFEFRVPVDIRQVDAVEMYGTSHRLDFVE